MYPALAAASLAATSEAPATGVVPEPLTVRSPDREQWLSLDRQIRLWWDQDLISATEGVIRDESKSLTLFLPFPYQRISAAPGGPVRWQFPVDTAFMNYALFAHDRLDIVRNHILNHLFMIERYGFPPNANLSAVVTRSQTPFFVPPTIWRYYSITKDLDLLYKAYPLLKWEYEHYWNASHHHTPLGLATNRDLGDPQLSAVLAAEVEVLDWMPVFGGDVRRCVPVATNVGLVSHARVLALMGREVGRVREADEFEREARNRLALINKYCWNEEAGLFLEYDYVAGRQLPYISEFAWWALWFGVASRGQATRLVRNLHLIEKPHGISVTDKAYPDPHTDEDYQLHHGPYKRIQDLPPLEGAPSEYLGGKNPLQWMYPAGWGTTQIILTGGLMAYGYTDEARRLSARFLSLILEQYQKTGQLWEKYNVVDGSLILPNARYGNTPQHTFTAAAAVLLGRVLFLKQPFQIA